MWDVRLAGTGDGAGQLDIPFSVVKLISRKLGLTVTISFLS
jgi:hypothetical protein